MPRYADESKERVRDAADMLQIVGARTELRRQGAARHVGLCPFHDERTPSFGVNPLEKVYHCFGCGASGDVFTFVMETEGLDFVAALEALAERSRVTLEVVDEDPAAAGRRERKERLHGLLDQAATFYARYLWEADEAQPAREYLASRKLEEAILRSFRVGYAPEAWDRMIAGARRAGFTDEELLAAGLASRSQARGTLFDRFRERVMFPLCDVRGRVLGFGARAVRDGQEPKYLNSSDGEVYRKGREVFGADRARAPAAKAGRVLVVEGYTDVIALHGAGIDTAVASMGTALTEEQATVLAGMAPRVCLALDADEAGQRAMERAARLLEARGELRMVRMPAGRDPADIVAGEGTDAMATLVEAAVPYARFRVERALETGDLSTASSKDAVLDLVRPVITALDPSLLREELVELVAARLGLSDSLASSLIGARGGPSRVPTTNGPGVGTARSALNKPERRERGFLALCIARPAEGRALLERVRDEHFTSELTRAAARHLRAHLEAPLEQVDEADETNEQLMSLLRELTLQASDGSPSPAELEVAWSQLELARLERAIAAARAAGEKISTLSLEHREIQEKVAKTLE